MQLDLYADPPVTATERPKARTDADPSAWLSMTLDPAHVLALLTKPCPDCGAVHGQRCRPDVSYCQWVAFHSGRRLGRA